MDAEEYTDDFSGKDEGLESSRIDDSAVSSCNNEPSGESKIRRDLSTRCINENAGCLTGMASPTKSFLSSVTILVTVKVRHK